MQFIIDLMLLSFYAFLTISIFVYIRRFWGMYVTQKFATKIQDLTIMLEIKLPREIDKSPLAMEMVISNMNQTSGTGTWYTRGIDGAQIATFSLEIASLEGVVHFYIRTQKKFKELLSASLYAHYPGVEVIETDDYTSKFPKYEHHKPDQASVWATSFKLSKKFPVEKNKEVEKLGFFAKWIFRDSPDEAEKEAEIPADALPIRTYIDIGLDKQKEEVKIDPLVGILEYFGSLGKGEYAALQIVVQDAGVHDDVKAPGIYYHPITHKVIKFSELAKMYRESLRGKKIIKKGTEVFDRYGNPEWERVAEGEKPKQKTYGQDVIEETQETSLKTEVKTQLELVERKLSKPLLACVMRTIYVTKSGSFRVPNIMNCLAMTKPFNAPGFNSLAISMTADPYDYMWQDPDKKRSSWRTEEMFEAFVEREGFYPHTGLLDSLTPDGKKGHLNAGGADSIFYKYNMSVRKCVTMIAEAIFEPFGHPHADEVFVLNTEELATLFHLPGLVASVPTLPRIDSRKAVAPVNLPV